MITVTEVLPTLYAKAKTGKIKQWKVRVEDSTIIVEHGQVDGKQTIQKTLVKEGKNIGKANATTPQEQALAEAQSKWNKQVDKDYRESVEDIPTSTLPPLAKKYQDYSKALGSSYDVLCKLDGVRCTIFYNDGDVMFQSRGGKPYPVIQEIADELYQQVWSHSPNIVLDGELYCHGMFLEDITSAVKKHNKDTPLIKFYVFDMLDPTYPEEVWESRYDGYLTLIDPTKGKVDFVTAQRVNSEEEMLALHDKFVEDGYEGVVCRKLGSIFEFGFRTDTFQKYKVPLDEEFKVIYLEVDKNGCAVPVCAIHGFEEEALEEYLRIGSKSKKAFKAPLVGTREYQQQVYTRKDEYVNRHLKVVFESYSKYLIPAKPKGHQFRDMDEDGNPLE